jgi:uncharacterized protein YyaL (SSP411 family)
MPNRLAAEHSPYLLQHKDNPVDWYPWGEDAFARAREEDKPIFLSIGYSTCHWCHVMEHESFEDADIAGLLAREFVAIKVDREERPDIDRVYMTFVQATTGQGGWPMSVWLTPSLEPFYGGTYFPPSGRWGRPGFADVLREIARVWREERPKVEQSAGAIVERLRGLGRHDGAAEPPEPDVLDRAVAEFGAAFDAARGGFGSAPKFPRPSELLFLLREHVRTGQAAPRDMALATLRAMSLGGMRDHVGGGFHRYAVDADWRVPHFEKMLYDQAQLVLASLEAAQLSGDPFFADVARDTLDYVRRDLADPDGGFHSAEDADSAPAGSPGARKVEGAFYVWHDDEIGEALGEDADVFRARFGVRPDGNAPADPQGEFTHQNLLYTARSIEDVAADTGRTPAEVEGVLARARATLFARREQRPRPHLDDKVLTAWNGLAIAAFARAARVLGREDDLRSAQRAAAFARSRLWEPGTSRLMRRYRRGDAGIDAYAEDFAYLIFGLLELFQADGDPAWLTWALELQRVLDERFRDVEGGGWFSTTGDDASVLLRLKEDYDGAEPAASSVGVFNLLTLAHLVEEPPGGTWSAQIARTLAAGAGRAGRAAPMMLAALSTYHAGMTQIVVVGEPRAAGTVALGGVVRGRYLPTAIVVPIDPADRERVAATLPWTRSMDRQDGEAAAYLCRDFACERPTTDPGELAAWISR